MFIIILLLVWAFAFTIRNDNGLDYSESLLRLDLVAGGSFVFKPGIYGACYDGELLALKLSR
jgi:hypothetical protein